jgi:hypothetical protein
MRPRHRSAEPPLRKFGFTAEVFSCAEAIPLSHIAPHAHVLNPKTDFPRFSARLPSQNGNHTMNTITTSHRVTNFLYEFQGRG